MVGWLALSLTQEKLQQVRDRVRWFISGETLSAVAKKVADIHKTEISTTALRRWFLAYPQLTGHLAWMRDKKTGEFTEVADRALIRAVDYRRRSGADPTSVEADQRPTKGWLAVSHGC